MKKLLIILILLLNLQLFSQDFDIETVKEIQTERELAEWIEAMLFPIVGETIVIANLTLDYPASRLQVYGSMLDKEKSLPGLPIAKSKSVMPTMIDDQETYPTIVARKEITIYLQKDVSDDVLRFIQQNVALWMNINPERGDVLQIRNIMDFTSGIAEEVKEKEVNNFFFLYMGIALLVIILVSVFILRSGFTKLTTSMQNINVTGFEKAFQIKGNLAAQAVGGTSTNPSLVSSKKKPIAIQLVDDKKDFDPFDFSFLEDLSIPSFSKLLDDERASDIAFILTNLNSKFVSEFMNSYIGETNEIMKAMLTDNAKSKKEIVELKNRLQLKFKKIIEDEKLKFNSKEVLVNVLNQLDLDKTKKYLDQINKIDMETGKAMREGVFLFSDIAKLSEHEIEQISLSTDHDLMVSFLKSIDRDMQSKFMTNLTPRAASIIREDMDYLGVIEQNEQEKIQKQMLFNIRNILQFIKE
ncbi:MAG: FliG C-terminal domain-containing protein [Candidatus Tenebribacter mawsonii]|nr:FliG C-terminal domain-containing protein [Candidatus Tenebribacter mawsonii]